MITGPIGTASAARTTQRLRFSIVIATLNRAPFLRQCLESVLGQRGPDYEVIVVDGGSTDGSDEILASFGSRLRVIKESGGGPGGARNVGVEAATGAYIVFVDSDDVLRPSSLALYATVLDQARQPKLLLASFKRFSDEAELSDFGDVPPDGATVVRFETYLQAAFQQHLSGTHRMVVARATYRGANGLAPQLRVCEDQDFGLRIGDLGPCVVILEPPTVGYRDHAGSVSANLRDFCAGVLWLIDGEKRGAYPGGRRWLSTRRAVITRTARSVSAACLDRGHPRDGLRIYRQTWLWHLRQLRLKYLVGFPMAAIAPFFSRRRTTR